MKQPDLRPYETGIGTITPDNLRPLGANPNGCETPTFISPQTQVRLAPPLESAGPDDKLPAIDFGALDTEIQAEEHLREDINYRAAMGAFIALWGAGVSAAEIKEAIVLEPTPGRIAGAIGTAALGGIAAFVLQRARRKDKALHAFQARQE